MSGDLDSLEQKIDQVLALCHSLDAENRELRERVTGLENEKQDLTGRMESARVRLEALMDKLPQE
ncbi:cell division protein ZapB [Denitratisoma oestradiolicum]|uniref:Cell division protein ZapB n=1 Tax=Denitratisoma oestradiolicum TaxID=311182 RepID=A0A6S6XZD8_9PROT|nr:cell division protein ZapB [Denitratisoma oestradiolicum]TWO78951.1 hypothetical protein CBW56_17485 [Denitratisoma oestradiolicum]CAB1370333.1 conserved protein of unknown function [Denitratisoma oestradiolicum]